MTMRRENCWNSRNTVSLGDISLSGFTGTGAAATSGHILFETV
jgi:hypothetical protein